MNEQVPGLCLIFNSPKHGSRFWVIRGRRIRYPCRSMFVVTPIATCIVRCSQVTLWAMNGRE